MKNKKKVISHLKGDIKTFKKEAEEDRELIRSLKGKKVKKVKKVVKKVSKKKKYGQSPKVEKVMHEFKTGKLHSGSKKGPRVRSRKQAIAIALSEARKAGARIPKKKKSRK